MDVLPCDHLLCGNPTTQRHHQRKRHTAYQLRHQSTEKSQATETKAKKTKAKAKETNAKNTEKSQLWVRQNWRSPISLWISNPTQKRIKRRQKNALEKKLSMHSLVKLLMAAAKSATNSTAVVEEACRIPKIPKVAS